MPTTVRRDAAAIDRAAADAILGMFLRPEEPPPTVVLPTELIVRESCGASLAAHSGARARQAKRSARRYLPSGGTQSIAQAISAARLPTLFDRRGRGDTARRCIQGSRLVLASTASRLGPAEGRYNLSRPRIERKGVRCARKHLDG